MKTLRYEYDIISGLNQKVILDQATTRQTARNIKRTLDQKEPQVTHRIIQRRYELTEAKAIR